MFPLQNSKRKELRINIITHFTLIFSVFKPKSWKPNTSCKYLRTKKLDLIYTDYIGKKQIAMTLQTIHLKHPPRFDIFWFLFVLWQEMLMVS